MFISILAVLAQALAPVQAAPLPAGTPLPSSEAPCIVRVNVTMDTPGSAPAIVWAFAGSPPSAFHVFTGSVNVPGYVEFTLVQLGDADLLSYLASELTVAAFSDAHGFDREYLRGVDLNLSGVTQVHLRLSDPWVGVGRIVSRDGIGVQDAEVLYGDWDEAEKQWRARPESTTTDGCGFFALDSANMREGYISAASSSHGQYFSALNEMHMMPPIFILEHPKD